MESDIHPALLHLHHLLRLHHFSVNHQRIAVSADVGVLRKTVSLLAPRSSSTILMMPPLRSANFNCARSVSSVRFRSRCMYTKVLPICVRGIYRLDSFCNAFLISHTMPAVETSTIAIVAIFIHSSFRGFVAKE